MKRGEEERTGHRVTGEVDEEEAGEELRGGEERRVGG